MARPTPGADDSSFFFFLNSTSSKIIGQYPPLVSTCHFTFAYTFWKVWTVVQTFFSFSSSDQSGTSRPIRQFLLPVKHGLSIIRYEYNELHWGWIDVWGDLPITEKWFSGCEMTFVFHWASIWLIISPAWIKTPLPHSDSNNSNNEDFTSTVNKISLLYVWMYKPLTPLESVNANIVWLISSAMRYDKKLTGKI